MLLQNNALRRNLSTYHRHYGHYALSPFREGI